MSVSCEISQTVYKPCLQTLLWVCRVSSWLRTRR